MNVAKKARKECDHVAGKRIKHVVETSRGKGKKTTRGVSERKNRICSHEWADTKPRGKYFSSKHWDIYVKQNDGKIRNKTLEYFENQKLNDQLGWGLIISASPSMNKLLKHRNIPFQKSGEKTQINKKCEKYNTLKEIKYLYFIYKKKYEMMNMSLRLVNVVLHGCAFETFK